MLETILWGVVGGISLGLITSSRLAVNKLNAILSNEQLEVEQGLFPPDNLKKIRGIMEGSEVLQGTANCVGLRPIECNNEINKDVIDCQQHCGPGHSCQRVITPTRYNNSYWLDVGKSYCLPDKYGLSACHPDLGTIQVSFDYSRREYIYVCTCKYPEIFGGPACDQFIACSDPRDPTLQARIWDRLNNRYILPDEAARGGIDYYETLPTSTEPVPPNTPRYRCACKDMNPLLTSGIFNWRCVDDPCFELLNFPPHQTAVGWSDDEYNDTGAMNCQCGASTVTRLYRHPTNGTCMPLITSGLNDIRKRTCLEDKEVFHDCGKLCGSDGLYMPRHDAVERGACHNPCETCESILTSPCGVGGSFYQCGGADSKGQRYADYYEDPTKRINPYWCFCNNDLSTIQTWCK